MVRLEHVAMRSPAGVEWLRDISLALEAGGFYCLTGPSGAGKTTLLRLIALADLPSRGTVSLFGVNVAAADRTTRMQLRRRLGIVFQGTRLIAELNVRDNVALPLRIGGVPELETRRNIGELLDWLGLSHKAALFPADLTVGERQRAAMARAIVRQPELLLADDPVADADADTAALLLQVFERLNRLGTTVLLAARGAAAVSAPHQPLHLADGVLKSGESEPAP